MDKNQTVEASSTQKSYCNTFDCLEFRKNIFNKIVGQSKKNQRVKHFKKLIKTGSGYEIAVVIIVHLPHLFY